LPSPHPFVGGLFQTGKKNKRGKLKSKRKNAPKLGRKTGKGGLGGPDRKNTDLFGGGKRNQFGFLFQSQPEHKRTRQEGVVTVPCSPENGKKRFFTTKKPSTWGQGAGIKRFAGRNLTNTSDQ